MEREMKISELAAFWNTSVNTAWNRIRKEGLTTVKKQDDTNKEVTFASVSDEILQKYLNNVNNNIQNNVLEGNYEELLTDINNKNNGNYSVSLFVEKLLSMTNDFNNKQNEQLEEIKALYKELSDIQSKQLLLEDKAGREGYYVNEINNLKNDNNKLNNVNYKLKNIISIMLISIISMFIIFSFILFIIVNKPINIPAESPQEVQTAK